MMMLSDTDTLQGALPDEDATLALGAAIARALAAVSTPRGGVIYLRGELGAGKTTLTRGLLRGLGVTGNVKSPTYTLVESYELGSLTAYHFDLYRLADAEELEYMGIRDYNADNALMIIEWPERGAAFLPPADLDIQLEYQQHQRRFNLRTATAHGHSVLSALSAIE